MFPAWYISCDTDKSIYPSLDKYLTYETRYGISLLLYLQVFSFDMEDLTYIS